MTVGDLKKQGFDVNGEILKIWKKYPKITEGSIFPLQYPDEMELNNDILVIGLNPSWSGADVFNIGVYPIFWTVRCVEIDGVWGVDFV